MIGAQRNKEASEKCPDIGEAFDKTVPPYKAALPFMCFVLVLVPGA